MVLKEEDRLAGIKAKLGADRNVGNNILLLGAASHLASHILWRLMLDTNANVTICDAKDPRLIYNNPRVKIYEDSPRITIKQQSHLDWDWLEYEYSRYDTIINSSHVHDAAYANNNPKDTDQRNVGQAKGLMDTLTKGSGFNGRLLVMSTDKVYGKQESPLKPINEDHPLNPEGIRATTRTAQEAVQIEKAKEVGISYVVFRLANCYGEFMASEKCIYNWNKQVLLREPLTVYGKYGADGGPARDFIHYDDVSALIKLAAITEWDNNQKNEVYNVGGCEKQPRYLWNIAEAIQMLYFRSGLKREPWRTPEESGLQIWLDSNKVMDKFFFYPDREFLYAYTMDMQIWIAAYDRDLRWSQAQIADLKKHYGKRDNVAGRPAPTTAAKQEAAQSAGVGYQSM